MKPAGDEAVAASYRSRLSPANIEHGTEHYSDATAYDGTDNHLILAAIALVSGHQSIRIPHPWCNATADTTGAAVEPSTIYNATERSES
jgi:hypothetical protein